MTGCDLLIFGNPDVGNPIAALAIRTEPMTSKFGCPFSIPFPTCATNGRMMSEATVWLMKVATTAMRAAKTHITPYVLRCPTSSVMLVAMVCSRPELFTAFPNARPPAARMMMVHKKLLKSSLVKIPVPKNRAIGMIAMTPMSPKTLSS